MSDPVVGCGLALSHPERLAILRELRAGGPLSGSLFADRTPSARQNRAAYHLRTLVGIGAAERTDADPFERTAPGRRHRLYVLGGEISGRLRGLLDMSGPTVVDPEGGESVTTRLADEELIAIGKAISHPMRVRLIRDLRGGGDWSPTTWADANDEALGDCAYHLKQLAKFEVAKVTRTERRRGAVEHFYELTGRRSHAVLAALDVLEGHGPSASARRSDSPPQSAQIAAHGAGYVG